MSLKTPSPATGKGKGLTFLSGASSGRPSSLNKSLTKKLQSQIKTVVQNFGKLLLTWQHESEQIALLLNYLKESLVTKQSVQAVVTRLKGQALFQGHPHLEERIISRILADAESMFTQLRTFQRRMGDLHAALIFSSHDASKLLIGQSPDVFPMDCVFNADHLLDIQKLRFQHTREYERKIELLHKILQINSSKSNSNSNSHNETETTPKSLSSSFISEEEETTCSFYRISNFELDKAIAEWPDSCRDSFINNEEVTIFLLRNGLRCLMEVTLVMYGRMTL